MKKVMMISVGALLLLSSCGSYAGAGAYTGGSFGSIIGSAIGGIAGGPRGSDIGTLIGMAGGAAVGAAVGAAADNAQQQKYEEYQSSRQQVNRRSSSADSRSDYSSGNGYDSRGNGGYNNGNNGNGSYNPGNNGNSGHHHNGKPDDRLFGFDEHFNSTPEMRQSLEIRNARILDATHDGVLTRGEEARMVFEIYNHSAKPVFSVQPAVAEVTGNRHIHISENVLIESIPPRQGIRYTAIIRADKGLKDGRAVISVGVLQGNKEIPSLTQQFTIQTRKR